MTVMVVFIDGFVAWKTKKIPTHQHKLAKKTLRDGSNGELTLIDLIKHFYFFNIC
jgi:hypothetical protein